MGRILVRCKLSRAFLQEVDILCQQRQSHELSLRNGLDAVMSANPFALLVVFLHPFPPFCLTSGGFLLLYVLLHKKTGQS